MGTVFRPVAAFADGDRAGLVHAIALSGRTVACTADVVAPAPAAETVVEDDRIVRRFRAGSEPGTPFSVCQRIAFADGPRDANPAIAAAAAATLASARDTTFDDAIERQRRTLDEFWRVGAVDIDGAADVERAVRFSTFQVFQATACHTGRASPAKGLTGQGYEGHHLWDQEIYVGQVLNLLAPQAAHAALTFRCRTLDAARARAAQLSHRGAQFPWRTIDGTEASAFFPAGAAQYHVNADVVWAIDQHVACTGDDGLLADGGLEVIVETARLWMSVGRFDDDGQFRIEGVTGPDEYTALVDDNVYTNLMAAANLRSAADRLTALERDDRARFASLVESLGLEPAERSAWRRAADAVVVPYDEELAVHGQDSGFLARPRWDLAGTPPEKRPLQDHYGLLDLYRHQVLKQADLVLALYLVGDRFTPEQRRRDFDYYEPLTTHDSSLSSAVHAVVAADVGRLDLAWRYARDTATIDLDDRAGTLEDGLHLAAAAGAWLAVVAGFGGLRVRGDVPSFRPQRPPGTTRLRFRLRFRRSLIEVDTDADGTTYRLLGGEPLTLLHGDDPVHLAQEAVRPSV